MNNKNIFKLVLPVALSASLVMVSNISMAGDLKLKPLKSPLSSTTTDTKKTSTSPLAKPKTGTATRTPSAPSIGGVNTNKLTPTNSKTTQSIQRSTQQKNTKKVFTQSEKNKILGFANNLQPGVIQRYSSSIESYGAELKSYGSVVNEFKTEVSQCVNKSYSETDERQAGCVASDTLSKCKVKLLRKCSSNSSFNLSKRLDNIITLQQQVNRIANAAKNIRQKQAENGLTRTSGRR